MRKFLFGIVLIGAAFAGGAVVNGPGLRWAQAQVLKQLGRGTDDATGDATPGDLTQPIVTESGAGGVPAAPIAPLVVESAKPVRGRETSPPPGPEVTTAAELPDSKPIEPKSADTIRPAAQPLPPLEAPGGPAAEEPSLPLGDPQGATAKDARFGDLPDSAPAAAVPPRPFPDQAQNAGPAPAPAERDPAVEKVTTASEPAGTPPASAGWSALRRKMGALGVSRYGFEGEPNGRVRFHCVIPLAGRRAVGQQFEAEGDDEFQAAQTALKRVALWRATENPGP